MSNAQERQQNLFVPDYGEYIQSSETVFHRNPSVVDGCLIAILCTDYLFHHVLPQI
jgi:hypothetical protein